jgi:catechol 2,3-dioxygenase-like lactoylglutathione lyase family enzyme
MTVLRLEHIGIVVDDLAAATAFFSALGLELEGEASVEGDLVDRINGLDGVRADVAMLRTPDGNGSVELAALRAHGGELVGELVNYEDSYWLCYVRGPAGIIVELAEKTG